MNHFIDHVKDLPIILLALYAVAVTIALACALERIGYWKQEAIATDALKEDNRLKEKCMARLEEDCARKQQAINEWRLAAEVLREDNRALMGESEYLRRRQRVIRMAWFRRRQKRSLYGAWTVLAKLP